MWVFTVVTLTRSSAVIAALEIARRMASATTSSRGELIEFPLGDINTSVLVLGAQCTY